MTEREPTSFERDVFAPLRAAAPTLVGIDVANGRDRSVVAGVVAADGVSAPRKFQKQGDK